MATVLKSSAFSASARTALMPGPSGVDPIGSICMNQALCESDISSHHTVGQLRRCGRVVACFGKRSPMTVPASHPTVKGRSMFVPRLYRRHGRRSSRMKKNPLTEVFSYHSYAYPLATCYACGAVLSHGGRYGTVMNPVHLSPQRLWPRIPAGGGARERPVGSHSRVS